MMQAEALRQSELHTPYQNYGTGNIRKLDNNNVKFITFEIVTLPCLHDPT